MLMRYLWLYIVFILFFSNSGYANSVAKDITVYKVTNKVVNGAFKTPNQDWSNLSGREILILDESEIIPMLALDVKTQKTIHKKAIAVTLAVTLGVFGVHRLYLGTSTKVPIIYTLTLGGGFGVLVVSDIIAIIATKNLEGFSPNPNVFMWAK